ncbi:MAG: dephospho-CoA kinase [Rhodospirillales bacterium]|nr:dephospho-CoA kinase [Rhodospirillales bacterium]
MYILGLTGSIGMGKTTAADAFRRLGVPVHDADATVHRLMGAGPGNTGRDTGGPAVAAIAEQFPDCVHGGVVDRQALGARVFGDAAALKVLEGILHPLVRAEEQRFLRKSTLSGAPLAVLDIPLLFETGAQERCDAVAVVSAPDFVQRQRVMARSGMTAEKMAAILGRQMPDAEKCGRADFVIQTGQGRAEALRTIREIVRLVQDRPGTKWPPT